MSIRDAFLVARFSRTDHLTAAVWAARGEGLSIHDVFAPCPVHGLDEAMGIRRTRLPKVTLLAGLTGLATAVTLQFYTNVLDWPLNVGGKPANSAATNGTQYGFTQTLANSYRRASWQIFTISGRVASGRTCVLALASARDNSSGRRSRSPPIGPCSASPTRISARWRTTRPGPSRARAREAAGR